METNDLELASPSSYPIWAPFSLSFPARIALQVVGPIIPTTQPFLVDLVFTWPVS